ncbi:MAG: PKD domain-containing protein [Bacteroidetes bacterium]|nr:PKD domain-containing protein [Bacteroidota bacterium]
MKKKGKNIEQLYSESFKDFRIEPSSGLWKRISSKLAWQNFVRFNLRSFNIYYTTGIVALSAAGIILLSDYSNGKIEKQGAVTEEKVTQQNSSESEIRTNSLEIKLKTDREKTTSAGDEKTKIQFEEVESDDIRLIDKEKGEKSGENAGKNNETIEKTVQPDKNLSQKNRKKGETNRKRLSNEQVAAVVADFSLSQSSGCASLPVEFTNLSENAKNYLWHFGDGGKSIEKDPKYIYDEPGEYEILLEVTGIKGENAIFIQTINVFPKPKAQFEIYPTDIILTDNPVNFHNYSRNAVRYEWDFGDSNHSDEIEPTHFYKRSDNYDIKLKVWTDRGCVDSLVINNAFAHSVYMIEFPNAFTPNLNGPSNGYYTPGALNNDVFYPVSIGVVEYQLRIFTHLGQLIFESNDINIGWDGYHKDKLAKQDVYIWKVTGKFVNGKPFIKAGDITLLH